MQAPPPESPLTSVPTIHLQATRGVRSSRSRSESRSNAMGSRRSRYASYSWARVLADAEFEKLAKFRLRIICIMGGVF